MLLIVAACSTPSSIESHFNRGVDAYGRGDLSTAVREFRMAVEDNPQYYRAWYNLGVAYHDLKQLDLAERAYLKALEMNPGKAEPHINIASIQEERGRLDEAMRRLQLASKAEPDLALPVTAMGHYWERRGDLDRAERLYREAIRRERTHVESNYRLGNLLLNDGNVDDGLQFLEAALKINPDDVPSLLAAARGYATKGKVIDAILVLQRAELRIRKVSPRLFLDLADLLAREDRLEDAVKYTWKARDAGAAPDEVERRLQNLFERLLLRLSKDS